MVEREGYKYLDKGWGYFIVSFFFLYVRINKIGQVSCRVYSCLALSCRVLSISVLCCVVLCLCYVVWSRLVSSRLVRSGLKRMHSQEETWFYDDTNVSLLSNPCPPPQLTRCMHG